MLNLRTTCSTLLLVAILAAPLFSQEQPTGERTDNPEFPKEAAALLTDMLVETLRPTYRGASGFDVEWFSAHEQELLATEEEDLSRIQSFGHSSGKWGLYIVAEKASLASQWEFEFLFVTAGEPAVIPKIFAHLNEAFSISAPVKNDMRFLMAASGTKPVLGQAKYLGKGELWGAALRFSFFDDRHCVGDRALADVAFAFMSNPELSLEAAAKQFGFEKRKGYYVYEPVLSNGWELRMLEHQGLVYLGVPSLHYRADALASLFSERTACGHSTRILGRLGESPAPFISHFNGATETGSIVSSRVLIGQTTELVPMLGAFSGVRIRHDKAATISTP